MRSPPLILAAAIAAAFAFAVPADAKVLVTIDKSAQRMTVAVDGERRWNWPVSTGRSGYDTPSGTYKAFRMEEDHYSKEWDDAPMPHSIFFTKLGHAVHGTSETRRLGTPASHGCVRLNPEHAAQLFALVQEQGVTSATVVITGDIALARRTPPRAEPEAARPARPAPPPSAYAERPYQQPSPYYADPYRRPYYGNDPYSGYRPAPGPYSYEPDGDGRYIYRAPRPPGGGLY